MEQGETPEYLTRRLIKRKQTMNYALRGGNDYAVSNYTKEICQNGLFYNGLNMYNDFKSKHCFQNLSELCSEAIKYVRTRFEQQIELFITRTERHKLVSFWLAQFSQNTCHSPSNAFKFSTVLEQTVGTSHGGILKIHGARIDRWVLCAAEMVGFIVGIWNYAHWLKFEKSI